MKGGESVYIFHNRPMASACWCFVLISVLLYFSMNALLSVILGIVFLLGTVISLIGYLLRKKKAFFLAFLCLFMAFLAVISSYAFFHMKADRYQQLIDRECVAEGTVLKVRQSKSYRAVFEVQLESLDGVSCNDKVMLKCEYASALQIGDRFSITAMGAEFVAEPNYDEASYAVPDGILGVLVCKAEEDCEILDQKNTSWQIAFLKWNAELAYHLETAVGGEEGKLANALLFGNRDAISDSTVLAFRRAGVSHLLALSGLHVSILIGFFDLLLRIFYVQRRFRILIIVPFTLGYLLLTGCAPSTARAVLMICMMNLGFFLGSIYDSFTSLSLILSMFLLITPHAVADIGMWMSFFATASIVVFLPALSDVMTPFATNKSFSRKFRRRVLAMISTLFIGVIANLALLLVQALTFGEYSVLSVPATLLLSIPLTLTLVFALLALAVPPLGFLCKFSAWAMLKISGILSSAEGVLIAVGDAFSISLIVIVTVILLFIAICKLKHVLIWCILPFTLSLLVIPGSILVTNLQYDGVRADYRIESSGDVFLFSENGQAIAVDFSDGTGVGALEIVSAAKESRCTELKDLIISHYHNRGTYFIHRLAGEIRVHNLRLPIPKNDWEASVAARFEEEASLHGIKVLYHLDDLCIPSLSITALDHALFSSDRHPALLMSVEANGKILTYVNGSLVDSHVLDEAEKYIKTAEIIIVGSSGHSKHTVKKLPQFGNTAETIVLANEMAEKLLPHSAFALHIQQNESKYSFYLK